MGESQAPKQHFDLKILAKSLKLASIDVIKTSKMDIESHWYRSIGQADLYYWKSRDKIVKHQISIYNQVIEWNEYDGVKTGYVNDDAGSGKVDVIFFDTTVDTTVVDHAIEFLGNVHSLDKLIVHQFITNYSFYNRWPALGPIAQLKRFFSRFIRK